MDNSMTRSRQSCSTCAHTQLQIVRQSVTNKTMKICRRQVEEVYFDGRHVAELPAMTCGILRTCLRTVFCVECEAVKWLKVNTQPQHGRGAYLHEHQDGRLHRSGKSCWKVYCEDSGLGTA